MKGKLIVFEGIEGSGKTTQIKLTQSWLQGQGYSVECTREPGGTELGQQIRQILLDFNQAVSNKTELLLYMADRAHHIETKIIPLLNEGKIVLCDRFIYSTLAYQGFGRRIPVGLIDQLNYFTCADVSLDLIFWLDISPEKGIQRAKSRSKLDRMESESLSFHQKVCSGYGKIFNNLDIVHKIDAEMPAEDVNIKIQAILAQYLI
jgi:dTMP kinase